jgi:hypothetical protein
VDLIKFDVLMEAVVLIYCYVLLKSLARQAGLFSAWTDPALPLSLFVDFHLFVRTPACLLLVLMEAVPQILVNARRRQLVPLKLQFFVRIVVAPLA